MLHHIILPGAAAIGAGSFNAGGDPPTPASSCTLGGTITTADEDDIIAGGRTITLTLNADGWDNTLGADNAITTALIDGITSAQSEAAGWNAVVKAALTYEHVTRTSDVIATIELPACPGYAVTANETITVTVPTSAVLYTTAAIVASPTATVTNVAETVVITGSSGTALTEEEVQTGSETLIFTVTGDQWVTTLGDDNAITTAFLAGIDSAQSEAAGWDAEVKANLDYTMLVRDSATQVTLTLPASASYNITANETITATIPATALLASSGAVVATPTVGVSYASVALTGTMTTDGPGESDIVTGGKTIIVTVTNDEWVATLGADNAITTAFLAGITSAQSEAAGWNAEVRDNLTYAALTRDSATVCTLTLPVSASYDITATETITCTIPATALVGSPAALTASPTMTVGAAAGAGLLFHSDWSTATSVPSTASADLLDSDKDTPWTSQGGSLELSVISASGLFGAGFANCLNVPLKSYAGSYQAFVNGIVSWTINPAMQAGDDLYIRFYFRNDFNETYDASQIVGGNHPNELEDLGGQNVDVGFKWDNRNDGTFLPTLFMKASAATKTSDTALDKFTEYRWEVHVHFTSLTSITVDTRIYDAAGTLVLDSDNFGITGQTYSAYSDGATRWKVGNNGPSWILPGQNTAYTAWRFGGVALRTDTWCGPYAGGV